MKKLLLLTTLFFSLGLSAQDDTTVTIIPESATKKAEPAKVFYGQRLVNAMTSEVLSNGIMEFRVMHNFGDMAGPNGGASKFWGLDNAADTKISFQFGLGNKLNIVAARARGGSEVQQLWELGLKYQFMQQMLNDPKRPLSITIYANDVISSVKASKDPMKEHYYQDFGDRHSQFVQLMIAKRFGNFSLQVMPAYVHTNYVVPGDQKNMFAIGAATRIPLTKKFFLIADYYHAFRGDESREVLLSRGIRLYDVFGVGFEILTEGHVFDINFTNATNILENRYIPRTFTSWGEGQFRWSFNISRRFVLFRDKKQNGSQ